jgi:6-phosphogluconolactonase
MHHGVTVDKPARLAEALAARLASLGGKALAARGRFALALPGGSVADAFFPRLARVPLDWARTDFFWGDERAVPPSHPDSNYAAARALWLDLAGVPAGRVHRMEGEASDLARAAEAYARGMVQVLGTPPRLDLVLLGVGEDGHVCSLFPGHALLAEEARWAAAVEDAPKPPPRRITLTLPALAAADVVVVAALGERKARAVRDALEDAACSSPFALLARRARRLEILLDPPAARLLSRR